MREGLGWVCDAGYANDGSRKNRR
ncbi:hypothetical protein ERY430_41205 [Erythrobacter sp. EC-HK427]|nr:hypothetical protein ERY430_41205 [Erythrobacter sp. EC-HK427]